MSNKTYQGPMNYISKRCINSTKVNSYSPTAVNSSSDHLFDKERGGKQKKMESDAMSLIKKQNVILKEENRILKRQLNFYKSEGVFHSLHSKESRSEVNDLRETIKKQAGEIKELKTRLEVLSKQCRMYEEVIEQMEDKIKQMIKRNKHLETHRYCSATAPVVTSRDKPHKSDSQIIHRLNDRVDGVIQMYYELQNRMNSSDRQWSLLKDLWSKEKKCYLHRIQDLENLTEMSSSLKLKKW